MASHSLGHSSLNPLAWRAQSGDPHEFSPWPIRSLAEFLALKQAADQSMACITVRAAIKETAPIRRASSISSNQSGRRLRIPQAVTDNPGSSIARGPARAVGGWDHGAGPLDAMRVLSLYR